MIRPAISIEVLAEYGSDLLVALSPDADIHNSSYKGEQLEAEIQFFTRAYNLFTRAYNRYQEKYKDDHE